MKDSGSQRAKITFVKMQVNIRKIGLRALSIKKPCKFKYVFVDLAVCR